jgi:hypothetical protein
MTRRALSRPEAYIPGPPSKAKRDRSWEAEQRKTAGLVAYRGVPAELNEAIKGVAQKLGVSTGEVARAFLEYGLKAFDTGELELHPTAKTGRFSLFHENGKS